MSALHIVNDKPAWGVTDLRLLKRCLASGRSLKDCARRQGPSITAHDCDLAAWALLGRSPAEAADVLNGGR